MILSHAAVVDAKQKDTWDILSGELCAAVAAKA